MGISRRTVLISAACAGDGAPIGWWHWSANWSQSVNSHFQWMQRYRTAVGAWYSDRRPAATPGNSTVRTAAWAP